MSRRSKVVSRGSGTVGSTIVDRGSWIGALGLLFAAANVWLAPGCAAQAPDGRVKDLEQENQRLRQKLEKQRLVGSVDRGSLLADR